MEKDGLIWDIVYGVIIALLMVILMNLLGYE